MAETVKERFALIVFFCIPGWLLHVQGGAGAGSLEFRGGTYLVWYPVLLASSSVRRWVLGTLHGISCL